MTESTTDQRATDHEGGFRSRFEVTTERGGPRYGAFSEEVRRLMDLTRYACPTPELIDGLIEDLRDVNERLAATQVDEWHTPAGTRIDLPARGNITLPPYEVEEAGPDGVSAVVTFRPYHLGGNNAAHGGQVAVAFDDLAGMASVMGHGRVSRTAYLTVDYRSITPLDTPLRCRTWVDRIEGRKVFIRGSLHDGQRLCAELDALFIQLKPGQQ
ncbi:PaaI family thioesterase [Sciscionella marina]|uniref:PaaI family thioesterase n=1 Tax=Sciscionella marina TaxID=508770 RepID=UPI000380FC2C|nr:PaaI family thioesterase [Sciscionella marina]